MGHEVKDGASSGILTSISIVALVVAAAYAAYSLYIDQPSNKAVQKAPIEKMEKQTVKTKVAPKTKQEFDYVEKIHVANKRYQKVQPVLASSYVSNNDMAVYIIKLQQNFIQGLAPIEYESFKNDIENTALAYNKHSHTVVYFYYKDTPVPDLSSAESWKQAMALRDQNEFPPNFAVQY